MVYATLCYYCQKQLSLRMLSSPLETKAKQKNLVYIAIPSVVYDYVLQLKWHWTHFPKITPKLVRGKNVLWT